MFFSRVAAAFAVALTLSSKVHGLPQITRVGRYLYSPNGTRFFVKGLGYQEPGVSTLDANGPFAEPSTFTDPLANATACQRDLPYLKQLGINAVHVYSVDAALNHDSCMQALSGAGIYVILDLALPRNGSIDRSAPTWSTSLFHSYTRTIDAFAKYDNMLIYNVGNEVVARANQTLLAPFIKAAGRDIKAYLKSKSLTTLTGYTSIDGDDNWVVGLASYFGCDPSGSNSGDSALDIFGINIYEFCGVSTFAASYATKTADFAGLNIPAYFSEYGCVTVTPRPWGDVAALFSADAAPVWSGGVAFTYFPTDSNGGQYGMITLSADGSTVTTSTDYNNLVTAYSNVTFVNVPTQSNAPAATYPACAAENTTVLASTTLPPTPRDAVCQCVAFSVSCQFTPQTSNTTAILGPLLDSTCALANTTGGGNCKDISGDGQTGTYGSLAFCDPVAKLSYEMSLYYEGNQRSADACKFAGNATVNKASTGSAPAVASSCLASATGTFVPPGSSTTGGPGSSSTSGSGRSGAMATALVSDSRTLLGVFLMGAVSVAGGFWSLA